MSALRFHKSAMDNTVSNNKYVYLWVVQGNWGYGDGWEDLTASELAMEAFQDESAYNMNSDTGTFRIIKRRELK
jgi:hypothetical protein